MIIRLRSRDGLERLEVDPSATVADLRQAVHEKLNVPLEDMTLSRDAKLLTAKDASTFADLSDAGKSLQALGFGPGEMVYLLYHFEREVAPAVKPFVFETRPFGDKMTIDDMVARQTRIERQETPGCTSASFERYGANLFQQYVNSALAFSIKRGGLLYGEVDEEGNVLVHAIYEPPQEGSPDSLQLERGGEEEQRVKLLAELLGWKLVGWIFTQSVKERDFIVSSEEVQQMAAMQSEVGPTCVTGVVAMVAGEDGGADVHFEAFQVSEQCVKLHREGWFQHEAEPSGFSVMRNPKEPGAAAPVIVAGKDVAEVDNDYFLIPLKILDHEGPLHTEFQIENRLLPQGKSELRAYLSKHASLPYEQRLADFHLLLYLAKQPHWDLPADMPVIVEAVRDKKPLPDGYRMIIDSLAGV